MLPLAQLSALDGSSPLRFLVMALGAVIVPFALVYVASVIIKGLGHVLGYVFGAVVGVFGMVGALARRSGRLVKGTFVDSVHAAGGILTAGVIAPLAVGNLLIGRFSAARAYGRAMEEELGGVGLCLYRAGLSHPVRFLGLGGLTDGLEKRLPAIVSQAHAPRFAPEPAPEASTAPKASLREFEGYRVVGDLPAGGSGAKLFLAQPAETKRAAFAARGHNDPGQVVIKSFALDDGSTLPQIVRESRALEAAKRLGLVLDHELTPARFHYVMPFVPGHDLDVVTRRLHAQAGVAGLSGTALQRILGYGCDLSLTLDRFHREGLWHKDIKPSNLIVSGDRLHLVDLGLVTPLASALTLTTHGTEYYRDPEMVRLAMQGVKVHEVDGVKFDLYSAGAVLYSMIENSFPAHGSLSRISKRCPDALSWIVRRCMADLATRYRSAAELGQDLGFVLAAADPFAVLPAELPSLTGRRFDPRAALASRPARPERFDLESVSPQPSEALHGDPLPPATEPSNASSPRRSMRRGVLAATAATGALAVACGGLAATFAADSGHGHRHGSAQAVDRAQPIHGGAFTRDDFEQILLATRDSGQPLLVVTDTSVHLEAGQRDSLLATLEQAGLHVWGLGGSLDNSPEAIHAMAAGAFAMAAGDETLVDRRLELLAQEQQLGAILRVRESRRGSLRYQLYP